MAETRRRAPEKTSGPETRMDNSLDLTVDCVTANRVTGGTEGLKRGDRKVANYERRCLRYENS